MPDYSTQLCGDPKGMETWGCVYVCVHDGLKSKSGKVVI